MTATQSAKRERDVIASSSLAATQIPIEGPPVKKPKTDIVFSMPDYLIRSLYVPPIVPKVDPIPVDTTPWAAEKTISANKDSNKPTAKGKGYSDTFKSSKDGKGAKSSGADSSKAITNRAGRAYRNANKNNPSYITLFNKQAASARTQIAYTNGDVADKLEVLRLVDLKVKKMLSKEGFVTATDKTKDFFKDQGIDFVVRSSRYSLMDPFHVGLDDFGQKVMQMAIVKRRLSAERQGYPLFRFYDDTKEPQPIVRSDLSFLKEKVVDSGASRPRMGKTPKSTIETPAPAPATGIQEVTGRAVQDQNTVKQTDIGRPPADTSDSTDTAQATEVQTEPSSTTAESTSPTTNTTISAEEPTPPKPERFFKLTSTKRPGPTPTDLRRLNRTNHWTYLTTTLEKHLILNPDLQLSTLPKADRLIRAEAIVKAAARKIEEAIFETSESKAGYLAKIKDVVTMLEGEGAGQEGCCEVRNACRREPEGGVWCWKAFRDLVRG